MIKILIVSIITIFLGACGGDDASTSSVNSNSISNSNSQTSESVLMEFMDQSKVCDLINPEQVQNMFKTTKPINKQASGHASKYSNSVSCILNWEREDIEQRKSQIMTLTMNSMQGKTDKISMRERILEHNFTLRLEEYNGSVQNFMPAKLSEEQLQKQIENAQKRASERLTDEQKKVAGKAANSMMERMLRQNNESIKIEGIGDSSFWTSVGGGSLNVLSGNLKLTISPMIAETENEDIDNAKLIAELILK
jgi:CCR4-NOT transcriptional regulation complex NOT5 subunit